MTTKMTLLEAMNLIQSDDYPAKYRAADHFITNRNALSNTDFYRTINNQRVELSARLSTLRSNVGTFSTPEMEARNTHWVKHWENELAAVLRAMHSLGEQQ